MSRLQSAREFARLLAAPSGPKGIAAVPSIPDMRKLAQRKVPKMIFDFVDGGAGDENTLRANERDFADVQFVARSLVDVRAQDTTAAFGGDKYPLPIALGPAGLVQVTGGEGELAGVKAASRRGLPYTISTSSAYTIEEIAAATTGPLWFQIYLWRSADVVENLISRAEAAGCTALVLTVDVPLNANRIRDLRNGMSIPPRVTLRNAIEAARRPRWLYDVVTGPPIGFRNIDGMVSGNSAMSHSEFINAELANLAATWSDLAALRKRWKGLLYIKGITTVADTKRALQEGVDGVIVSNHGGRQLDSLPSAISSLPAIVDAVNGDAEVLLDGGVRSGADVAKALAIGADAVTIGRPWVYGAAAGGEAGVSRVLSILEQELAQTLALVGVPGVEALDRDLVRWPREWSA